VLQNQAGEAAAVRAASSAAGAAAEEEEEEEEEPAAYASGKVPTASYGVVRGGYGSPAASANKAAMPLPSSAGRVAPAASSAGKAAGGAGYGASFSSSAAAAAAGAAASNSMAARAMAKYAAPVAGAGMSKTGLAGSAAGASMLAPPVVATKYNRHGDVAPRASLFAPATGFGGGLAHSAVKAEAPAPAPAPAPAAAAKAKGKAPVAAGTVPGHTTKHIAMRLVRDGDDADTANGQMGYFTDGTLLSTVVETGEWRERGVHRSATAGPGLLTLRRCAGWAQPARVTLAADCSAVAAYSSSPPHCHSALAHYSQP
jgi:hypothetical protein